MRRLLHLSIWVAAVLATGLVIAIATSSATPSSSNLATADPTPVRLPPIPGKPDPPDPGAADAAAHAGGPPPAAPADLARALSIARSDATLQKILGSIAFQVTGSQPWFNSAGDQLIGTELDLRLSAPLSGAERLPGVRFNADGSAYRQLMLNARVTDASTMTVFVDLRSKRVVSAMPPDSTLTELPGNQHFTPTGGPNGD
jgi:hypothetical protein